MEIGQKIKNARIAKNMTQEELGNHIGVQKSAIAKYESGRVVNIKRSTLQKIAKVLDLRPSELIFEEKIEADPVGIATQFATMLKDPDFMELYEEYKKLNAEQKKMAKKIIRSLSDD